jgi:K(+)-stimulated pyrophosphate-energized sodium pump
MNNYVIFLAPAFGILGLLVMAFKSAWVSKQDAGEKNMQDLAATSRTARWHF